MSGVPYTFASATSSIPLSELDSNFATPVTIGTTSVALGNTVTTLANVALANVTISSVASGIPNNFLANSSVTIGNTSVALGNTVTSLGNVTLTNVTISSGTNNIATNVASVTGILSQINGGTGTTTGYYGFKNRIINGAMVIAQYGTGSTTPTASGYYSCDRWYAQLSQSSKYSIQQNAGSVTPPVGYTNYLGITSASAYSITSTDQFNINQRIEGFNIADLAWGTANAKTVTLSFQVYSSLTGTFGGAITNSAVDRSYPFSYTISSANTWTTVSVTIAGDTTGTWVTNNGIGIRLYINLGAGSTLSGTAGSWAGATYTSCTGATSVVGTSGATFYITGVQLEVGAQATSFDYRPYGTELALCQRYYQIGMYTGKQYQSLGLSSNQNTTSAETIYQFKTSMRSPPTLSYANGSYYFVYANSTVYAFSSLTQDSNYLNTESSSISATISGATTGQAGSIRQNNVLGFVAFSAEL